MKMLFPCLAKILPNPIPYLPWDRYIYLHLVDFYGFHVGKYTSPMDGMGIGVFQIPALIVFQFDIYKVCETTLHHAMPLWPWCSELLD